MLEFIRPYIPELVGWFRDFGVGAANYDANGHYARIQPIFNAFQLHDMPGRPAAAGAAAGRPAPRRPADRHAARAARAPRASPPADGSAPYRDSGGNLDCDPTPGAAGPMIRAVVADPSCSSRSSPASCWSSRSREDEQAPTSVRAIFDNAGFVIPGEDVKIAGVKVGKIDSLDVTQDFKAAVVLDITEPGYQDFRSDASCIVRPQIADRRALRRVQADAGARRRTPRRRRAEADRATAPGEGQYLLPVANTTQTVDIDLIGNTMREPERERLSLILNELGTGARRPRRATSTRSSGAPNPALQETDKVLAILARQNTHARAAGGQLGHDPGAAGARPRRTWRARSATRARWPKATAERRGALEADIQTLPAFLDELRADDGAPRRAGGRRRRRC